MTDAIEMTWTVRENNIPQIIASMKIKVAAIVAKAALDWQAQAQVRAPVDTGALKNSIQAIKISDTFWKVIVGVHYGAYQEYGTVMHPAQPFFAPAGAIVKPQFLAALKGVMS